VGNSQCALGKPAKVVISRTCCGALMALTACAGAGPRNSSVASPAEKRAGDVAVIAGRILDPRSGAYSGPSAIIIRQGRIVAVTADRAFSAATVDSVIDLRSLTVLPGLIDAHVHLAIGGTARANAKANVEAGFTTVVDLGSFTNRLLRVRDSINSGLIPGPRVLASGRWIGTKGGVCEFNGLGIAGGVDLFRQRVVENVSDGADLIKVCVSGWLAEAFQQPEKYEIADSVLAAVVSEAHRRGRKVIAHDLSAGGVRAALRAGVDGLAHSALLDERLATELRRRRMFMISTLASLTAGDTSEPKVALRQSLSTAQRAGVLLVFGTDGGVLAHGQNVQELLALKAAGLSSLDVIRMATVNAATALGIADSVGAIRPGMSADLIAVAGDPLVSTAALREVSWVMLRGQTLKRAVTRGAQR